MINEVAKLARGYILGEETPEGLSIVEQAWYNIRQRANRVANVVKRQNPDLFLLEYALPGSTCTDKLEWEHLQPAVQTFDEVIRAGATYALLQALWMSPDGCGELFVNIGLHDLS